MEGEDVFLDYDNTQDDKLIKLISSYPRHLVFGVPCIMEGKWAVSRSTYCRYNVEIPAERRAALAQVECRAQPPPSRQNDANLPQTPAAREYNLRHMRKRWSLVMLTQFYHEIYKLMTLLVLSAV